MIRFSAKGWENIFLSPSDEGDDIFSETLLLICSHAKDEQQAGVLSLIPDITPNTDTNVRTLHILHSELLLILVCSYNNAKE